MTNDLVKRLRDSRYDGQLMMRVAAADRIEEMDAIFDLRWECDRRAIKQWQEAHPGNDRTWPDGADLCVWLMEKVEELERQVAESDKRIEFLEDEIQNLKYEMCELESNR